MWFLWISGLVCGLVGAAYGGEVCYDKLGCFSDDEPWAGTIERPISQLPWSPEKIGTRFLLFTRENPDNYQEIPADSQSIAASNYKPTRKTRFVIHGYIDKGDKDWLVDMCKIMLTAEDVNCICVDWKAGGRTLYTQAANNIRVVGAQVAHMISIFKDSFNQMPENVHVIGHSLGAHCAGEVGSRTPGLGRITGLDPAEPYFQDTPEIVRLDPTDAKFVDAIHTDSLPFIPFFGLGMSQTVGHLDFFPNGGEHMPGCDKIIPQKMDIHGIWEGVCNHLRAYKYYSDSILSREGFMGYRCSDKDMFESGQCFPCNGSCHVMGHYADSVTVPNGVQQVKYYLNTADEKPFARYRYKVRVTINGTRSNSGFIKVALYGATENTYQYQVFKGTLTPGETYEILIDTEKDVGELARVKFVWNNNMINPLLPKFGATNIEVLRGKDNKLFRFCGDELVREGILQTLNPC